MCLQQHLAIASFCLWSLILFCLPETLRNRVGDGSIYAGKSWVFWPSFRSPVVEQGGPKSPRPTPKVFWKLFTYPPIGIVSFNTAVLFASYYCIAVTQPRVLTVRYKWDATAVGLSYLASGKLIDRLSLFVSDLCRNCHDHGLVTRREIFGLATRKNDQTIRGWQSPLGAATGRSDLGCSVVLGGQPDVRLVCPKDNTSGRSFGRDVLRYACQFLHSLS